MGKKYLRHVASKYKYPTRFIKSGSSGGGHMIYGSQRALEAIERRMGRKLRRGFRARHTRTTWVFLEVRGTPYSQERQNETR